jgi:hypothetical protein
MLECGSHSLQVQKVCSSIIGHLYSDKDLVLYHVIILIHYRERKQAVILGYSSCIDVEQDKAVLPSARSPKNSSHGHVTISSLFLVGADVAVNNIKLLSAAMEMQQWIHTAQLFNYKILRAAVSSKS